MAGTSLNRWNEGFFRALERPALRWLVAVCRHGLTPDLLTGIGAAGAILTFAGYALSGRVRHSCGWRHSVLRSTGSVTLSTARLRGSGAIERPRYGYYLDNTIDCIAALLLALGMGLSGLRPKRSLFFSRYRTYMMMFGADIRVGQRYPHIFRSVTVGVGRPKFASALRLLNALIIVLPPTPFQLAGVGR